MQTRNRYLTRVPALASRLGFQRKTRPLFGARAFLRGRAFSGARRGASWSKVRLQWRRPAPRLAPAARATQGKAVVVHSLLTRVHLHLYTALASSPAAWRGKIPAPHTIVAWARPQNSSNAPLRGYARGQGRSTPQSVSPARAMSRPMALARPAAVVAPAAPHALARTRRAMPVLASQRPAASATANIAWRRSPSPSGTAASIPGARAAGAPRPASINPLLFGAAGAFRGPAGAPALARATAARDRAAPLPAAALWHRSTPELVWSKQVGARAGEAREPDTASSHAGGADGPGRSAQAASAPRAAQVAPSAAAIAAQPRGGALDAALADRLATEVIRRVERSMRIERERRGY